MSFDVLTESCNNVPINDITPFDIVYNYNTGYSELTTSLKNLNLEDSYNIHFLDGRIGIYRASEYIQYFNIGKDISEKITTEELYRQMRRYGKDYLRNFIIKPNEPIIFKTPDMIDYYLAGVMLSSRIDNDEKLIVCNFSADAITTICNKYNVTVNFCNPGNNLNISFSYRNNQPMLKTDVFSDFVQPINGNMVVIDYSKFFKNILHSSPFNRMEFMRGVMDNSGGIIDDEEKSIVCNNGKDFLIQIQNILRSLGVISILENNLSPYCSLKICVNERDKIDYFYDMNKKRYAVYLYTNSKKRYNRKVNNGINFGINYITDIIKSKPISSSNIIFSKKEVTYIDSQYLPRVSE